MLKTFWILNFCNSDLLRVSKFDIRIYVGYIRYPTCLLWNIATAIESIPAA